MPNNKKQRGRDSKKKNETQKKAAAALVLAEKEKQRALARAQWEAAAIDNVIKDIAATEKEDGAVCYHGSSADHFVAGSEFLEIAKSYMVASKNKIFYFVSSRIFVATVVFFAAAFFRSAVFMVLSTIVFFLAISDIGRISKNMGDDEFPKFLFALGVSLYLKLTSKEKKFFSRMQQKRKDCAATMESMKTPSYELLMILRLGLYLKYDMIPRRKGEKNDSEQFRKYRRDIESERGIINCLYRETKNDIDCDCMTTKKVEARNMDKEDLCHGCDEFFPKARTMVCDGCQTVVYCSDKCQSNDWKSHKSFCTRVQRLLVINNDKKIRKNKKKKK